MPGKKGNAGNVVKTGHLKRDCRDAGTAELGMAATAFTADRGANENINYVNSVRPAPCISYCPWTC